MRPRISVRSLVRPSVSPLVGQSVTLLSNSVKKGFLQTQASLDKEERRTRKKEGQGGKRDKEEGGKREEEGQGGRRDE